MILRLAAVLGGVVLVGGLLWVRLMPISADDFHRIGPETHEAGDWSGSGGYEAVRQVPAPKATLAELVKIALASPGTELLEGTAEEGLVTVVTRTPVLGIPEITNLWIEGDRVHLRGHGAVPDLGLGDEAERARTRIGDWLARVGLR